MIRKKQPTREIVIDLTGPNGNVFVLMGYARILSRYIEDLYEEEFNQNAVDNELWNQLGIEGPVNETRLSDRIVKEMMMSDYENAVQVFDRYFGHFVVLER